MATKKDALNNAIFKICFAIRSQSFNNRCRIVKAKQFLSNLKQETDKGQSDDVLKVLKKVYSELKFMVRDDVLTINNVEKFIKEIWDIVDESNWNQRLKSK